jgi:glycosyltransferase involved in cell wall biosynthesis
MNILQVISSSGVYGAETMIVQLSRWLEQQGHLVAIGVFVNSRQENTDFLRYAGRQGLHTTPILCKGRMDRSAIDKLRAIARREQIDLAHAHGYKADFYCYLAFRKRGIGLVSTCHNWLEDTVALQTYGCIDRFVLRRYHRVVAVSEAVATIARRAGIPEERISIIDNGIELDAPGQAEPVLRAEYPQRRRLVGIVGRLALEKGIDVFLRAAALVASRIQDCQFIVVGDGPDGQELRRLCHKLGLEERVTFTGVRRDMLNIYASFDIQVSASLKEGLPMVLLEGLAAGKPIVATSVGAVERVVINGQTGLLVPPGDPVALAHAIVRLLENPALAKKLASAGRELIARQFSADRMASDYARLYRELVPMEAADGRQS